VLVDLVVEVEIQVQLLVQWAAIHLSQLSHRLVAV
jgi:hypothetical protein